MTTAPESPLQHLVPGAHVTRVRAADVVWDHGDLAAEYAAIRGSAAKIDLSGAGLVEVTGTDAYDLLQQALARDLEFVTPEQSLISLLLDANGTAIDVVTAYYAEEGFRLETSIGTGPATVAHLTELRDAVGQDAEIALRNDDLTLILIEGPQAATVLEDTIDPDLGALPLSGLMEIEFSGAELVVSRTGFTGEYGYKLFVRTADAVSVWEAFGAVAPAGVGALEAAMFEVRQPVLHRESSDGRSALANGWSWLIDVTKDEFHGRDAVIDAFEGGARSDVVGFAAPSATEAPAVGSEVSIGGTAVGTVVHAVFSPGRKEFIGLARMRADLVAPHLDVTVGANGGSVPAATLAAPYVVPASWKTR
jgi:glycine cleavage system aminomethyltransferase T